MGIGDLNSAPHTCETSTLHIVLVPFLLEWQSTNATYKRKLFILDSWFQRVRTHDHHGGGMVPGMALQQLAESSHLETAIMRHGERDLTGNDISSLNP